MFDETQQMKFADVLVIVDTGLVLKCRVGEAVVSVPPLRMLPGTTVRREGDCGTLILPTDVAQDLGLTGRFSSTRP